MVNQKDTEMHDELIAKLKASKSNLHPKLEYLADSLIKEYTGFGHLSEFSIETVNDLIERAGA